jgi:hypothetical protein
MAVTEDSGRPPKKKRARSSRSVWTRPKEEHSQPFLHLAPKNAGAHPPPNVKEHSSQLGPRSHLTATTIDAYPRGPTPILDMEIDSDSSSDAEMDTIIDTLKGLSNLHGSDPAGDEGRSRATGPSTTSPGNTPEVRGCKRIHSRF